MLVEKVVLNEDFLVDGTDDNSHVNLNDSSRLNNILLSNDMEELNIVDDGSETDVNMRQ